MQIPPGAENGATLRKVPTYIAGLEDILEGGLPQGRMTLITGGPGSGKTLLGLEFLYRGALEGEPGILVCFEERTKAVRQNASSLGWDLSPLENAGTLCLIEACPDPTAVLAGEFNLLGFLSIIAGQSKAMGTRRIVIDAIDVLLRIFHDPVREQSQLHILNNWLIDHELTAILTVKTSRGKENSSRYEFLDFMADCVLQLGERLTGQVATRYLRVVKYRGSGFGRNEYPYSIGQGGMTLIPISKIGLQHKPLGEKMSSGLATLDETLDGGFRRASCVLLTGNSGTGKTTLLSTFAEAACKRGEKVLYISFEESPEAITSAMLSPGINLRPALEADLLRFNTAMPEAMGAEEHLIRALQHISDFGPQHVLVDAISSCERMGTSQSAFDYVMRLANACKERGITCLLANQTEGFLEQHEISGMDFSSFIDAVIILRYIEIGGEVNRLMFVMKSRGSTHSNQYREYAITDHGLVFPDVYLGEGGVMTGVARQEQEAREAATRRYREQLLRQKEFQVSESQTALEAEIAARRAAIATAEAELATLRLEEDIVLKSRDIRARMRDRTPDAGSATTSAQSDISAGGPGTEGDAP
jgi:circadian clock protein KaiC